MPGGVADEAPAEVPIGGGEPIVEGVAVEVAAETPVEPVIGGEKVLGPPLKSYKRRSNAPPYPSRQTKF